MVIVLGLGLTLGFTLMFTVALCIPPAPVQVSVYAAVPVAVGVMFVDPEIASGPLQLSVAAQLLAPVEDQVRVEDCPETMLVAFAVRLTVGVAGGGVLFKLPLPPPQDEPAPADIKRSSDKQRLVPNLLRHIGPPLCLPAEPIRLNQRSLRVTFELSNPTHLTPAMQRIPTNPSNLIPTQR